MNTQPRRPPGSYGLPLIGSVLGTAEFFLFGWERYFSVRRKKHGTTVFKVNLFQPTIAVLDAKGIAPLFADEDLIQDYGFSWAKPPRDLVGQVVPSLFEKGPAHDAPKAFILEVLAQRGRQLPAVFDKLADEYFARWARTGSFAWADEIENFSIDLIFEWVLGVRPDRAAVRRIYNNIFLHFLPAFERLMPGSNLNRSLRDYRDLIAFIRSAPQFVGLVGLAGKHGIPEADLPHRLAFLLGMNGFLGVQSSLKSVVGELARNEGLRRQLGKTPLDQGLLDRFIREVLRLHPPVFFLFGRATRERTLETASGPFRINKGELVMGVVPIAQVDPALFSNPQNFDPSRYEDGVTGEKLIWPRGRQDAPSVPGDKVCPGKDPAVLIAKLFCTRLASRCKWRLARPPTWTNEHYGLNVAAPEGDLAVLGFEQHS